VRIGRAVLSAAVTETKAEEKDEDEEDEREGAHVKERKRQKTKRKRVERVEEGGDEGKERGAGLPFSLS
jgi:hypothetical protein